MNEFPKKIWLQWFDEDGEAQAPVEVCWCEDQINGDDPCYVLESALARKDAALGMVREAMKLMRESGADKREYVVYAVLSSIEEDTK